MEDKVFIYLRLRAGGATLARSKIREFGGLGGLLAQFLHQTMSQRIELPADLDPERGDVPVLDYVDANTDAVLITFRVDPEEQVQVIEGRIPPDYQGRMLDPEACTFSQRRFADAAGLSEDDRRDLSERLARSQVNLMERIKDTMDDEGNFVVQVPLGGA